MSAELLNPYCTLDDLQRETRNLKPEKVEWFIHCINRASRFVDEYCRRDFLHHVYSGDDYYVVPRNAIFEDKVFLPFPINSFSGLWVYNRDESPTDLSKWPVLDYYVDASTPRTTSKITAENGLIFGPYPFNKVLAVQGDFGYPVGEGLEVSDALPANVRKATAMIAAAISMERRLEQTNLEGNRIELLEFTVPREAYQYLNRFRSASHML